MVKAGRRISVTTIDNQKVTGRSLGVVNQIFGKGKKKESKPVLRIEKRDYIVSIPLHNLKRVPKNIRGIVRR